MLPGVCLSALDVVSDDVFFRRTTRFRFSESAQLHVFRNVASTLPHSLHIFTFRRALTLCWNRLSRFVLVAGIYL